MSWHPGFVDPWTKRNNLQKIVTYHIKVHVNLFDFGTLINAQQLYCIVPCIRISSAITQVVHLTFILNWNFSHFLSQYSDWLPTEWVGNRGWIPGWARYTSFHQFSYQLEPTQPHTQYMFPLRDKSTGTWNWPLTSISACVFVDLQYRDDFPISLTSTLWCWN